jgi:hypothetical protein
MGVMGNIYQHVQPSAAQSSNKLLMPRPKIENANGKKKKTLLNLKKLLFFVYVTFYFSFTLSPLTLHSDYFFSL